MQVIGQPRGHLDEDVIIEDVRTDARQDHERGQRRGEHPHHHQVAVAVKR